jgi:hypothetical protein
MKRSFIAGAALALAVTTFPALVGAAQAAPKAAPKSPFCSMAPAGNQSWAEYYGCWGGSPKAIPVAARGPAAPHNEGVDYCKLSAAGNASWAEHYGCWRPHR